MVLDLDKIQDIIINNPNKDVIDKGIKNNALLSAVVLGQDYKSQLKRSEYFEGKEVYLERSENMMTNVDLFARLLRKEKLVFTARGGSVLYDKLSDSQTKELNTYLSDIRNGMSLKKWIEHVCLNAYEVDPAGVIFIERDKVTKEPYPVYNNISTVYDYLPASRKMDYVVFSIKKDEIYKFINISGNLNGIEYYRVVCDNYDRIVKLENKQVTIVDEIIHGFKSCPCFVVSDIIDFQDSRVYKSKLFPLVELGLSYMINRSIRDLTRKYHGFPKEVQPLTNCRHCEGGYKDGKECPVCHGTGYKGIDRVSDVIRIPLEQLAENSSFDIRKIFTYITPEIAILDKQDNALNDIENLMQDVNYGTDNRKYTSGVQLTDSTIQETATKTLANLQPIYVKLEEVAKWGEETEKMIIDFIAQVKYESFSGSTVVWGKDYILESSEELYTQYSDKRTKGCPAFELNDAFERYLMAKYQSNPVELSIAIKLMRVEPFVHLTIQQVQTLNVDDSTLKQKIYFSEWYNQLDMSTLISKDYLSLKQLLIDYVSTIQLTNTQTL